MLAAIAVVGLFAVPGCDGGNAKDREYAEIISAVDDVMGDLRADDYANARGRLCEDYSVDTLREEFDWYAKPWTYKVTGSEYTPRANGLVNLLLTAGDKREQAYTLDLAYRDSRWQVCRYLRGTYGSVD
jgi:hypothetical protein